MGKDGRELGQSVEGHLPTSSRGFDGAHDIPRVASTPAVDPDYVVLLPHVNKKGWRVGPRYLQLKHGNGLLDVVLLRH